MQTCASIRMKSPGYVRPVGMYIIPYECVEPCDAYAEITWLNYTDVNRTFTPGIILDGVLTTFAPWRLAPGAALYLGIDIRRLSAGFRTIEPFPNGENFTDTVHVYPRL